MIRLLNLAASDCVKVKVKVKGIDLMTLTLWQFSSSTLINVQLGIGKAAILTNYIEHKSFLKVFSFEINQVSS